MTDVRSEEALALVRDKTVIVQVPPNSKLEQLLCIKEVTQAKYDAAKASYDELKDAILAELTAMHPEIDIKVYDIPASSRGMWRAMTYAWQKKEFLPSARIKEHLPPVYEAFKQVTGFWRLDNKGKR